MCLRRPHLHVERAGPKSTHVLVWHANCPTAPSKRRRTPVILTILVVLLLIALLGGGFGHSRGWGYYGWSPLGLLILIVLILALTGNLNI